ncbi:MAG: ABC transporter substrate-binding protein [Candidatus Dormibacteraceae bacterium]
MFAVKSLDPARASENTNTMVDHAVYSTLLTLNADDFSKPVTSVATSYTSSTDGRIWTFKLRKDIKFSDGTPLTSADVVFSFMRLKNVQGIPSVAMSGVTVTAADPNTVVLTSSDPNGAIPYYVTDPIFSILNSAVVKQHGGTDAADADKTDQAENFLNQTSAGSGPYVYESISFTSQIVLKANPNYWGQRPVYSRVVIRNVQPPSQRINVQSGDSQMALDLSPTQAVGLENKLQVVSATSPWIYYLGLNASPRVSSLSADPNFREAVRYGIDYKGILQLAGPGAAQSLGFVPKGYLGALSPSDATQRDVARAKAALARSGISNPTIDLHFFSDISPNGISFASLAARIQADLKDVGITVNLVGEPYDLLISKYRNKSVGFILTFMSPDIPDPIDGLVFYAAGGIYSGRLNWNADAALGTETQNAATAVDPQQRLQLFQQLQRDVNDRGPFVFLLQPGQTNVSAEGINGVKVNTFWYIDFDHLT